MPRGYHPPAMEGDNNTTSAVKPEPRFGMSRGWDGILLVLLGWHFWMCLGLFAGDGYTGQLFNEEPIISGRHAMHLYEGFVGAQALRGQEQTLVYDPVFYAGYLKTPWFDAGSKPAELFLLAAKAQFMPSAYKLGVLCSWFLLPVVLAMASRLVTQNPAASCLGACLTMVVAWSDFGRERLWGGDLDLIVGAGLAILTLALGINYHNRPHAISFVLMAFMAWLLCLVQPLIFLSIVPPLLVFYFGAGGSHGVIWHGGFVGSLLLAVTGNWFWLQDALKYWWVRSEPTPLPFAASTSLGHLLWRAPVFKDDVHQGLAICLLIAAAVGIAGLAYGQRGLAARTVGAALAGYLAVGLFGTAWNPLSRIDPGRSFFIAILLATLAAGEALVQSCAWLSRATGSPVRGVGAWFGILTVVAVILSVPLKALGKTVVRHDALQIGLTEELRGTVEELRRVTTTEARILWEEDADSLAYSPLMPWFTGRFFMSGLGACGHVEHAACGMAEGKLEGRPLSEWSDRELADYCRRYNIGWIVCRTDPAITRISNWNVASATGADVPLGRLFEVRQARSYVIVGQGRVERCDHNLLTLVDLVPEQGQVVLSFHHHIGIRPSVDQVTVEKEPQLHDPIPLIRLKVPNSMARLTLRWEE